MDPKAIGSYPSIFAIGHRGIADIFNSMVAIQEKVDGSQFSFARIDGELVCRSKGQQLATDAPEKMFRTAVNVAGSLDLHPGWIYRAEYLQAPKHNTLAYGRVPTNHLALFDVQTGVEEYLGPAELEVEAERLGIEAVPLIYFGMLSAPSALLAMLDRVSFLGTAKIEGVVVKNYNRFTHEKKIMIGKYVSEAFKEKHATEWGAANPTQKDFVQILIGDYKTDARWRKAIQHLRDAGQLEGSPKDIGKLITEVPNDIRSDSEQEIKDRLFQHFWPHIKRGVVAGFPEFYKRELLSAAFDAAASSTTTASL